jgi:hypothetical protein
MGAKAPHWQVLCVCCMLLASATCAVRCPASALKTVMGDSSWLMGAANFSSLGLDSSRRLDHDGNWRHWIVWFGWQQRQLPAALKRPCARLALSFAWQWIAGLARYIIPCNLSAVA